jgi:hypothetical protein
VNATRWRIGIAARRRGEALELARQAAGEPDYLGPCVEQLEQIAAEIAEIRAEVHAWVFNEHARHASSRPRPASRGRSRVILKALIR